ncbi:protein kinase [Sorangium cellulosum]|uniref:Protein kinase n=1 Tax=Sorangium cellulosum TaxID=56 RepID=A0A2L0F8C3_SORCE|nr:TonB family protein [Sorangium cellulosum]AUX47844.1 protein kinase [Sorangium cellulosum]
MGSTRSGGHDPLINATIAGRYRIVSLIARGGMGRVYRAEQSALGRLCALKLLCPDERREQDPEFFRRFSREAATAARLTHPNSVTVFDYGRDDQRGIYFIAMEYIAGRTLHRVLHDEAPLPEARANRIARQICRALAEAHGLGLVHRDLKPSNVLLVDQGDEKDFVKVLDFGLVKDVSGLEEELTQKGLFIGSPRYTAPEQAMCNELSPRADIYSLGVLLYEMLCGKVPFDKKVPTATLMAHVSEPPPPLAGRTQGVIVSPAMEAFVMRCLEKSPDRRFQSMKECLLALKSAAGEPVDLLSRASAPDRLASDVFVAQPGATLPPAPSGSGPRISALSPPPFEIGVRAASRPPLDSLSPPQAPPTFSGPVAPARHRSLSLSLVAIVAAAVGGALVLAFGGRAPDAASAPAAIQPAVVPVAVPAEPSAGREPGPAAEFRIVRIESAPSGARVSDRGTEVCLATPCRLVLQGAGSTAEYQLQLTKPGYRTATLVVRPGDETASVELEAAFAGAPAPPPPREPDPAGAPRPDPAPPAEAPPPAEPVAAAPVAAAPPEPPPAARAPLPAALAPAAAVPAATARGILPFQSGMTRPAPISAPAVAYTREARQARVEGTVIAKCVVTTAGSLTGCRIIKGLPHMDEAVLSALAASRYRPITFQGRPVNVDYVFSIKLVLP